MSSTSLLRTLERLGRGSLLQEGRRADYKDYKESFAEFASLLSQSHFHCHSPVITKGSFDSLSLEECLKKFLIGLLGLTRQLLLPLPSQSLSDQSQ